MKGINGRIDARVYAFVGPRNGRVISVLQDGAAHRRWKRNLRGRTLRIQMDGTASYVRVP
jgi:hypothetical protein